jgi:hypothetical protein
MTKNNETFAGITRRHFFFFPLAAVVVRMTLSNVRFFF